MSAKKDIMALATQWLKGFCVYSPYGTSSVADSEVVIAKISPPLLPTAKYKGICEKSGVSPTPPPNPPPPYSDGGIAYLSTQDSEGCQGQGSGFVSHEKAGRLSLAGRMSEDFSSKDLFAKI